MILLPCEMVDVPGEEGAYYQVDIRIESDGRYSCTIPGIGKCIVAKKIPRYSYQPEPFAWTIVSLQKGKASHQEQLLDEYKTVLCGLDKPDLVKCANALKTPETVYK